MIRQGLLQLEGQLSVSGTPPPHLKGAILVDRQGLIKNLGLLSAATGKNGAHSVHWALDTHGVNGKYIVMEITLATMRRGKGIKLVPISDPTSPLPQQIESAINGWLARENLSLKRASRHLREDRDLRKRVARVSQGHRGQS